MASLHPSLLQHCKQELHHQVLLVFCDEMMTQNNSRGAPADLDFFFLALRPYPFVEVMCAHTILCSHRRTHSQLCGHRGAIYASVNSHVSFSHDCNKQLGTTVGSA